MLSEAKRICTVLNSIQGSRDYRVVTELVRTEDGMREVERIRAFDKNGNFVGELNCDDLKTINYLHRTNDIFKGYK